ncbi:RNA polymerase subunit Rpo13 [Metallosphaera hakonensis]|uniref:RNA polymerase subunit Rpo13 n=1 Tax=Metallosphaera hakonensis TaxID=79601 RepID=UPI0006CF4CCD|nr:RNA polymerase subunit Rpo13 [Metallosphaera hakonensis]
MSEDYEDESEPQTQAEDVRTEDEDEGGVPAMSLQDIELLTKNTEVWHNLISGKISLEEAKKEFEDNNSIFENKTEKSKARPSKRKVAKKTKKT